MQIEKKAKRLKRAHKTRAKLKSLNVTRLVVNRTSKHIYAQVIVSDISDRVVASVSTIDKQFKEYLKNADKKAEGFSEYSGNVCSAKIIGKLIALSAIQNGVTKVSFDRSGYKYHGRVKALADSAREAGLQF